MSWRRRPQRGKTGNGRRGARTRHRHPLPGVDSNPRIRGWERSASTDVRGGVLVTRQGWLRGAAQVMWEGRRRALLGGLGMRRERRGEETARHGTSWAEAATGRNWLVWWLPLAASLAAWLLWLLVRVWGGAGRLWITGGAPSWLAHSFCVIPLISAGCRGILRLLSCTCCFGGASL